MKATNSPQTPTIPGMLITSGRNAGTCWIFELAFDKGAGIDAVSALLKQLQPGHEVCFDGPGPNESYLEARRTETALETKTGFHGCFGSWRATPFEEAVEFLRPAIPHNGSVFLHRHGSYTIYPTRKYEENMA